MTPNTPKTETPKLTKEQIFSAKLIQLFDGEFSAEMIMNKRNSVFYRIANFTTPAGTKVSTVLTEEQIGEIINDLDNLQYSRRMQAKIKRLNINFEE